MSANYRGAQRCTQQVGIGQCFAEIGSIMAPRLSS